MKDTIYRPLSALIAGRASIVVPDFTGVTTWVGVSLMLARYPVENTGEYSLKLPIDAPNGTIVACVSWTDGTYVFRYKLWEGGVLYWPVYNGERIGANSYIEIWSTAESNAPAFDAMTFYTSRRVFPDLVNCLPGVESKTLVAKAFTSVPSYQAENPFCSPLCL